MVFGLYQRWFRKPNKDFCEKSFFEEIWLCCSATTMGRNYAKVSVLYVLFKTH